MNIKKGQSMLRLFFFILCFIPLQLVSDTPLSNVLLYKEAVQVNSEINEYSHVVAGIPIQGSIMITHDANNPIDVHSFAFGDKPLKVELVQSVPISSYSHLMVSIYRFELEGMKKGIHTLQPIKVKVGGKEYQAPPLTIEVGDEKQNSAILE
jgi:hypothetical protein